MSLTTLATRAAELATLPDALTRAGVSYLVARARRRLDAEPQSPRAFARKMSAAPVARAPEVANAQHYELPASFFERVLGPQLKYSSGLYPTGRETLAQAETAALVQTSAHAELGDGQDILELGCGWGSLTLFMAQRYPASRIIAVSNSTSQRRFIEARAAAKGLTNVRVVTCDMNDFTPEGAFDRVVSVEMFEHIANWRALLERLRPALRPAGRLFLHVFTHRDRPYSFDESDPSDFIARHFFTGGIMPSHDLIGEFADLFEVEADWRWSGRHYERTALHWLERFDASAADIASIFADVYGADAGLWLRRWRLFFLAVAGLFGDHAGRVWGVSHYRLRAT